MTQSAETSAETGELPDLTRNFYTTSSCGLCGKASIDAVLTTAKYDVSSDAMAIDAPLGMDLKEMKDALVKLQTIATIQ